MFVCLIQIKQNKPKNEHTCFYIFVHIYGGIERNLFYGPSCQELWSYFLFYSVSNLEWCLSLEGTLWLITSCGMNNRHKQWLWKWVPSVVFKPGGLGIHYQFSPILAL